MRKLLNSELERLNIDEFKNIEKTPLIVILDDIRSLNNIGSVFRTSDAFLVQEIFLCGITAQPPHREIHKTALGSTESVKWSYFEKIETAIEKAKILNFKTYAIEQADDSISFDKFHVQEEDKIAVIFGNEVKGVNESILAKIDGCLEIPQYGTKHSLNISVCAGIVIYELFQKLNSIS